MRTSRRARTSGFTLVELGVIVLVIALLSALVVPRMSVAKRSINAKLSLDAVQRLASRARETSISSGRPVSMSFNETDRQFELKQQSDTGDENVVGSAALPDDFTANRFAAGESDMSSTDWKVTFYPDATSDGGTIELDEGGILRTLVIGSKSGLAKWQDGATPDNQDNRWQAGEIERRG